MFWFTACEQKSERIMDAEKFKNVLKEMHLADGVVGAKKLSSKLKKDTLKNIYSYVFKKHNISRSVFENTMRYYSENTVEYVAIYEQLIAELQTMEDSVIVSYEKKKEKKIDSTNLWNRKERWDLPIDGKTNPISYKLKQPKHGIYTLSADIKLYTDDGSVSQRMTIMVKYEDGTKEENSVGNIKKDGKYHTHEVFINTDPNKKLKEVSGWILNHSKGTKNKHAKVKDIKLTRKDLRKPKVKLKIKEKNKKRLLKKQS